MQKKIADVVRYSNFAYNCKKFRDTTMTKPNIVKKHIATSFHNLSPELQEAVKAKYPLGFTDAMIRVDKPNGDFFYAVPYDTDEIAYMVKIDFSGGFPWRTCSLQRILDCSASCLP